MTKYMVGVKSKSISFKLNYSSTSLELRALSFFLYFFLLSSFPFCSCFSTISVANSCCFDVLAIWLFLESVGNLGYSTYFQEKLRYLHSTEYDVFTSTKHSFFLVMFR